MTKSQKIDLIKIGVSAVLYVLGFVTGNFWVFMAVSGKGRCPS